jgi:hypothetical protein
MRKTNTIFSLLIALLISGVSMNAAAQRRSHQDDRTNTHTENRSRNYGDSWSGYGNSHADDHGNQYENSKRNDHRHHDRDFNHHSHREIKHVYHKHDRGGRPVVVHHHIKKPRYVYFRDYDVYYDCHRSVYISYSGRSWTVSAGLPRPMRNVNVRTARSYEVDYYNDDFPNYLERSRPSWGREYRGW